MRHSALTAACLSLAAALPALASSDEAWNAFREEVRQSCAALAPTGGETMIEVNPFGSDSYGAALIVHTVNDDLADRYVCIYDKASKKAELSAPFTPPGSTQTPVAAPDGTIKPETQPTTDAELIKQ